MTALKQKNIRLLLLLFWTFACSKTFSQPNPGFERGLQGWIVSGNKENVVLDSAHALKGKACARIGAGAGLYARMHAEPFAIVQFDAYVKSAHAGARAYSYIRFYDSKKRMLLEYKSACADSTGYQQTGNYTEAPAFTSFMEIGIEQDPSSTTFIYADDFTIEPNVGSPKKMHPPEVNLDEYMKPFWRTDTIFNETVLLYKTNDQQATGRLLYRPDKIISIENFDLHKTYKEGTDYVMNGDSVIRTSNSAMPYRADTSFDRNDLAWFNLQSQWVVVSYIHHDAWTDSVPRYKAELLPASLRKLQLKQPLKIVAFGMSITRGLDVSSYDGVSPYMPTYVNLFARQLRKSYHYHLIKLYNAGLPGATVDWGASYAEKYINPLKPDLVIIDFGMNDFWRLTPAEFEEYINRIIQKIKQANPQTEFILLSNMKFDPDYVVDRDKNKIFYQSNLKGYSLVLKSMEKTGVVNLDMYSISNDIYNRKKAKDCLANPLHPNDYLARWYAQGLSALLIRDYK